MDLNSSSQNSETYLKKSTFVKWIKIDATKLHIKNSCLQSKSLETPKPEDENAEINGQNNIDMIVR